MTSSTTIRSWWPFSPARAARSVPAPISRKFPAAGARISSARNGFAGFVYAQRSKPWIAAVNGVALAGGCELALACDMIVASEGGAFGLPEVTRGLIASGGGVAACRVPFQNRSRSN
ncbi:MAG TPA: enoyl-CoA hydratase-related protein [Rhizomicrobium sp.]|nr:enoyl-CoA hydratase-related protein [Rhizomicrobium sp.]